MNSLSPAALDQLFLEARSQNAWSDRGLTDAELRRIYDVARMGATGANCCPGRFLVVRSDAAKARLARHAFEGNKAKVLSAPVTVVMAHDLRFFEHLPRLFPIRPMDQFAQDEDLASETAFRNGTLQAAYFMMAARALGFDLGPMSGFDNAGLDAEFFPDGRWRSNFLCGVGVGDPSGVFPRLPRLAFEEACQVI